MDSIDALRSPVRKLVRLIAKLLNKLTFGRLTPNMVTAASLFAHIPIAWFIAYGKFELAALMLVIFGLFDALDGELARLQKKASPSGMFIDSTTDRMKEIMLYTGMAAVLIETGETKTSLVILVATLGISVLISYLNAWGEVVLANFTKNPQHKINKTFRSGLLGFDLRILLLIIGLATGELMLVIYVIFVLGVLTVIQRFTNVVLYLKNV